MAYASNGRVIDEILEKLPVILSPEAIPVSESKSRHVEQRLLATNPALVAIVRETIDTLFTEVSKNPDILEIDKSTLQISDDQLKGVIARTALTTLSEVALALGMAFEREQQFIG